MKTLIIKFHYFKYIYLMNKVNFQYNGVEYIIECSDNEKFKNIVDKLFEVVRENRKTVHILYNGVILNQEFSFNQCANKIDKSRKCMNVIVFEMQSQSEVQEKIIKSKYIICPKCHENAFLKIKDFKISIVNCKNGHRTENLDFKDFEETQCIDISKIKCDNCQSTKFEALDNKFFVCNSCEKKLCPRCKDSHDQTHKIKIYEENHFYCKEHNDLYINYCSKCKKDLCSLCQVEHLNHKLISYSDEIKDLKLSQKDDLKDTLDSFDKLKKIIKNMIDQLNKLNTNLDKYYEIYNDISSNYNQDKMNYYLEKNLITMKTYNDNFLGNISEILVDTNLKSQFRSIINLYSKFEFKKMNNLTEINKKNKEDDDFNINEINEENNSNINLEFNEINNLNNINENDNNENNVNNNENIINDGINQNLDDKYNNFSLNKLKELVSYIPKYSIETVCFLNDRRILTFQSYSNEKGYDSYKICVYSINKGFICDINIDCSKDDKYISYFHLMNDGNVLIEYSHKILITKITKDSIEEIWKLESEDYSIETYILLNGNFLIRMNNQYNLYKYEENKLISYKDLTRLYKKEDIYGICQITENEYALFSRKTKVISGEICYIIFYDMKVDKKIKSLKIGKGEKFYDDMLLLNETSLIINKIDFIVLIDVKNRNIIKEFKYELNFDNIIILNQNYFLYFDNKKLSLYELEGLNDIKLKEEKELLKIGSIVKYSGNKLLITENKGKKITIYGYN